MKNLITFTILTCATTLTFAQSYVTLYGTADAGLGRVSTKSPILGSRSNGVRMISDDQLNNGNSAIGLRGVEQLGHDASVGFKLETDINLNDGRSHDDFWSQGANIWIRNSLGMLKLGRAFTPSRNAIWAWELTGTASYSVVAKTYGFDNAIGGFSDRQNSQFLYETPTFGGVTAQAAFTTHADNLGRSKLDVGVMYDRDNVSGGLSINRSHDSKVNYSIGSRYNFNRFAIASSFDNVNDQFDKPRRGFSLGGTIRLNPMSLTLDITHDIKNEWSVSEYKRRTNALLEGKYNLSKQTFLYAAYLRFDGSNNFGFGIHHNF